MEIEDLIKTLHPSRAASSYEALQQQLAERVAYLIAHDFERLVRLLYTIDVDERGLKHLLQQTDRPAADVIAELMLQRQLQKMQYRQQAANDAADSGEERW